MLKWFRIFWRKKKYALWTFWGSPHLTTYTNLGADIFPSDERNECPGLRGGGDGRFKGEAFYNKTKLFLCHIIYIWLNWGGPDHVCVSSNNITDVLWREGETNWTNIAVGASFSDVVLEDYFASADWRQIDRSYVGGWWWSIWSWYQAIFQCKIKLLTKNAATLVTSNILLCAHKWYSIFGHHKIKTEF